MRFDIISSLSVVSGPGNSGQRFVHLQFTIDTDIGKEEFARGVTAFWRRIVAEPDDFPSEFWQLFLQSSLTALGEKCRPVCVGITRRRLITAGAMRQWRPRLEEDNRELRQFGVAVPKGVEHVGLRAPTMQETGNCLVITDCSNAFSGVKMAAVLAEAANFVPALTPLAAKCYSIALTDAFFRMDSGKTRTTACSSGVQRGDPMDPAMFFPGVATGAEAFQREVRGRRIESLRVHGRCLSRPYGGHGQHR